MKYDKLIVTKSGIDHVSFTEEELLIRQQAELILAEIKLAKSIEPSNEELKKAEVKLILINTLLELGVI